MVAKTILKTVDVLKRLKARSKTPKETTKQEAKLVRGAGDKSDPTVGRYGAGQKQQRGGATKTAKDAMSDAEKDTLARTRSAKGSLERSKKLEPGSLAQLGDEYDKLIPSAKRAERMKGSKSKFLKVFKARGMAAIAPKSTPKGIKKKTPKAKPKSILEGYKETKQKHSDIIDFKKGGMTGAGLYPAEMARSGTMSQAKRKKNMKKGGSISYKMTGGQVVSHGYD
jgi:hypothetical protein